MTRLLYFVLNIISLQLALALITVGFVPVLAVEAAYVLYTGKKYRSVLIKDLYTNHWFFGR